jgi:hypothetical protein
MLTFVGKPEKTAPLGKHFQQTVDAYDGFNDEIEY